MVMAAAETNYVPWQKYKSLFERKDPIPAGATNFEVVCKLCKKKYSTTVNSCGNLKKHMMKMHPQRLADLEATTTATPKRTGQSHDIRALMQPERANSLTQEEFDRLLLGVIIESKLPFQMLERPRFRKFMGRLAPGRSVFYGKTARLRVSSLYKSTKAALIAEMARATWVGTTADAWKSRGKGYLGVTAHWLDPEAPTVRKSAALACRRVTGRQTYDVLAGKLCDIFQEFDIQGKISCTVTDNGSNFCKAFREFSVAEGEGDDDDDDDLDVNTTEDGDELLPVALGDILDDGEASGDIRLPPHRRCASHTLNLVATKDLDDALSRPGLCKTRYDAVLSKCKAFWSKQARSTVSQDIVKKELGKVLPVPNATRWNAMFDAMGQVLWHYDERRRPVMRSVCETINVEPLTAREVEFLAEYVNIMEPLASTLDLLQGEKHMSVGYLLPALHNLLARYRTITGLKYCQVLVDALIASIEKRFQDLLWDRDLVLAACLVPLFRLDWIRATVPAGNEKVHQARAWLEDALSDLGESGAEAEEPTIDPDEPEAMEVDSTAVRQLFSFLPNRQRREARRGPSEELDEFLNLAVAGDGDLTRFKYLQKLYIRYNTCLPSSASAERLFSHAGLVLNPRRSRLGDRIFDELVFLGVNQDLF